jgi:hypothetical protein
MKSIWDGSLKETTVAADFCSAVPENECSVVLKDSDKSTDFETHRVYFDHKTFEAVS